MTEKALSHATFDWLSEVFAPEKQARVMEQIACASDQSSLDLANATRDLKEAETRIARLADAVESGTFALGEIEQRLRQHREKRDRAKAVIAAAQGVIGRLDAQAIGDLFHWLGGLVTMADRLTTAEPQAIFEAAELSIHFDPTFRQATFKVDLARGVNVRTCRRGTRYKTPHIRPPADLDVCLAERLWKIGVAA